MATLTTTELERLEERFERIERLIIALAKKIDYEVMRRKLHVPLDEYDDELLESVLGLDGSE
jgi:hypothetical protein